MMNYAHQIELKHDEEIEIVLPDGTTILLDYTGFMELTGKVQFVDALTEVSAIATVGGILYNYGT